MKEIKIKDCIKLRDKFKAYCATAEQHEFPVLLMIHGMMDASIEKWQKDGVDQKEARSMFRVVLKYMGEDDNKYREAE